MHFIDAIYFSIPPPCALQIFISFKNFTVHETDLSMAIQKRVKSCALGAPLFNSAFSPASTPL